jgi:hypothetical protein
MNKILALTILMSFTFCFSQIREKGTIELTPMIGYSSSNYSTEVKIDILIINAVGFGINADYYYSDRWSLRSSLLLHTMGGQYIIGGLKIDERLQYLTIPLNANWHFGSLRKWNLNFGFSLGVLTAAETYDINVKNMYNPILFGLNYGVGYKFLISDNFSILVDFQGIRGLTYVEKDPIFGLKSTYNIFNLGGVFKL